MHPIEVSIPSFRSEGSNVEKGYTVFKIEVLMCGRQHTVEKRYSEFHALHNMAIIMENEVLPKIFLDFLNIRHFPSLPKTESCGKLTHQPALLFQRDPYLLPTTNDTFSNMVIEGVIRGIFYPDFQPR
ncbi:sorting nexin-24-like isoform X5 [Myxocyprinus asiaticus]|uniref:sorting nexin-24-like isoform X5 n=1 Tax=Myxocyprinus asiaticus TaxID=70543 RepID=UPI002222D604|nr:sorting nexin-24-like isoform X5 [Myxocyprinus asiaticus]